MYAALLLILFTLFAWVSWRNLRYGVLLIAATLPSYLLRFEIAGIPMTVLEGMILLLAAIYLLKNGRKALTWNQDAFWTTAIALILFSAIVATIIAPDLSAALGILKAYFIEPILLFLLATRILTKRDIFYLYSALGASALFVSLAGIMQYLTHLGIPAPWDIEGRITSIFPYPNAVGLFLGPIVILGAIALYAAIKARKWKGILFWSIVILSSSIAIVLAKTEAALVAIPATLLFLSLFDERLRRFTIPAAIFGTIILLAIPSTRIPIIQKLTLQDYSGGVRLSQWHDTAAYLKDAPLLGAGLSGYPTAIAPYHSRPEIEIFQYPHNVLLNTWVELGVLGLLGFAALAVATLKTAFKTIGKNRIASLLTLGAAGALIEMHIHGLVDVPYLKNDLAALTWLLLAIIVLSCTHYVSDTKTA